MTEKIIINEEYEDQGEVVQDGASTDMEMTDVESSISDITEDQQIIRDTNDMTEHNNLHGRDVDGAHIIEAITGLREALDDLNTKITPKVLYSDERGYADYYAWSEGQSCDDYGYFVSMVPDSSNIQICTGKDIFGVTVNKSAFVGGYDANGRDNTYALVATSGFVTVRCETSVAIGNYVVPNSTGMAKKSESGYGYLVVAKAEIGGDPYATIMFNVSIDQIDGIGANVISLNGRMDSAYTMINEAMRQAALANQKAENAESSSSSASNQVNGVYDYVDGRIPAMEEGIKNAMDAADNAKKEAISHADQIVKDAKDDSNEKWVAATTDIENAKTAMGEQREELMSYIDQNAGEISSIITSIDTYSVGEYSQSYGLTLSQARAILKDGMIYIPTDHKTEDGTHTEAYTFTDKDIDPDATTETVYTFVDEFTPGYYYKWENISLENVKVTYKEGEEYKTKDDVHIGGYWWNSHPNKVTRSLSKIPSSSDGEYWYTEGTVEGEVKENGYESYTLYVWRGKEVDETGKVIQEEGWKKVNTLSGNVNNRIINAMIFTPDEFGISIASARGGLVDVQGRVSETESQLSDIASWQTGTEQNVATVRRMADANSASVSQIAYNIAGYTKIEGDWTAESKDLEKVYYTTAEKKYWYYSEEDGKWIDKEYPSEVPGLEINAASIVTAINNGDSEVKINADHVEIDGAHISLKGQTIEISADDVMGINSTNFTVDKTGKVWAKNGEFKGKVTATSGQIGGWSIDENNIYNGDVKLSTAGVEYDSLISGTSRCFLSAGGDGIYREGTWDLWEDIPCFSETEVTLQRVYTAKFKGVDKVQFANGSTVQTQNGGEATIHILEVDDLQVKVEINIRYREPQSYEYDLMQEIIKYSATNDPRFKVFEDGSLYAQAADITGTIHTEGGHIGGFNLSKYAMETSPFLIARDSTYRYNGFRAPTLTQDIDDAALTIGCPRDEDWNKAPFYVTFSGDLYARNIRVDQGDIGKWYLNEEGLMYGKPGFSSSCCLSPTGISSYPESAFGEQDNISLAIGEKFYVSTDGMLHANLLYGDTIYLQNPDSSLNMWLSYQQLNFRTNNTSIGTLTLPINGTNVWMTGKWYLSNLNGSGAVLKVGESSSIVNSSGTSVTFSDKNLKNSIAPFSEKYDVFFDNLIPSVFKYNEGSSDRLHGGFIAQEVGAALEKANLSTQEFAGYVDCRGMELDCLGLRYEEFISLNTWQIQKLKARVTELENQIALLKEQ